MKRVFSRVLPSVGVLAMLLAAPAYAQDVAEEASDEASEEIVVTGTSIRGVAPAGAAPITLDVGDVAASNATNTVQLLSTIPQIGQFNDIPRVTGVGPQQATNIASVRGLGGGTSGSSPTLILMDGHRLPGAGVVQTIADPDTIPPGVIQRVEVVTDGGSAIYGADAVGGVINFVTRSDFDGVEFNLRQGFGDEYSTTDGYVTVGKRFANSSAYLAYNYSQHDAIFGRDGRDYVRSLDWRNQVNGGDNPAFALPLGRCAGSVSVGDTTMGDHYLVDASGSPLTAAGLSDVRCDNVDNVALYPQERRDSLFGGFSVDLTNELSFDLRSWYMVRTTKNDGGASVQSAVITPGNNNFYQDAPGNPGASQTVYYSFDGVPGYQQTAGAELETYGFSPSVALDIGADWQMRAFFNYGHSYTTTSGRGINNTLLQANFADFNFYDPLQTDPVLLNDIVNGPNIVGRGESDMVNGRVVFDGPVFTLPGGEVRAAVGAEYLGESYEGVNSQVGLTPFSDDRRSHAFFGELNVPIVGKQNDVPLVDSFVLSLSARHDTYSDFGSVTTPRVGLTYEPLEWITLRGNWGKSFQAPSLADTAQTGSTGSILGSAAVGGFIDFTLPDPSSDTMFVVFGADDLEAQRAETYSVGFDIRPPVVEGLELGASYYSIDYTGRVASPSVFLGDFWRNSLNSTASNAAFFHNQGAPVSDADATAFLSSHGISADRIAQLLADDTGDNLNLLIDFRRRNLASVMLTGYDAYVRYNHETSFGSIFANANATYQLSNKINPDGLGFDPNSADNDGLISPRWGATLTVGATVGEHIRGQATLVHSADIPQIPSNNNNFQDSVDAYDVLNLYLQYDFLGAGLTDDLAVSLGINNAFDQDPPQYNGDTTFTHGYLGGTLGRVVTIGLSKRF